MLVIRLAADLGIWLVTIATFLSLYVGVYELPNTALIPHARLIAVLWLFLTGLRIAAHALLRRRSALWLSSLILAVGLAALLAYYGLVIVGLKSWGGVVTWDLMHSYAMQFPAAADALGLSQLHIAGAFCLAFTIVLAVTFLYLQFFDWVPLLWHQISSSVLVVIFAASLALTGIEVYAFSAAPWTRELEPLSLTLFPQEGNRVLQAHRIDRVRAERQDLAEDLARASFSPEAASPRRNVILIIVDALRPDHLALLGYPRDTTPNLSAIASKSIHSVGLSLHASCAESACGLLSLATSKYVHQFSSNVNKRVS